MPPWERYDPNAAPAPVDGPWTKFQPAPAAAQPPADTTKWREPGMLVPVQFSEDGQYRWAVPQLVTDTIKAIEGPGKAMRGEYGLELDPITMQPTPITDEMMGDAMGGAGLGLTTLSPAAGAGAAFGRSVIGAPARKVIQRELESAGIPLDQAGPRLAQMGQGAVYADLTPGLQARAAAIATMPGSGQKTIIDALSARRAGSNARIMTGVDEAIGPATIPSRMAAENAANKAALGPQYDQLFAGQVRAVDSSPIALNLDSLAVNERGAAQAAAKKVRGMLNVAGETELDPNPYTLFKTRQAIDGLMATEADPGAIRVLAQARKEVDDLLAQSVPGIKDLDAQYAELARQGDAVQTGQKLLDTGREAPRPSDVEEMMSSGALPQGAQIGPSAVPLRLREGARADIDRIIGTNIRDINAMKRIVAGEGNWNRDKLATVFGADKAAELLAILEREAAFNATEQLALQGSRTQVLKAAQDDIVGAGPRANPVRSAANLKFGDALSDLADRSLSWVSNGKRANTNQQIADALMAQADNPAMGAAISQRPVGMSEKSWMSILRALAMQPVQPGPVAFQEVQEALLGPRR
jgi:hypothetical protein